MKFDIRTTSALMVGVAAYIALGPDLDRYRGVVDCIVLAEMLSRIFKAR